MAHGSQKRGFSSISLFCNLFRSIEACHHLLLRDPLLPADLLPAKWPGDAARDTCRALYKCLLEPSEKFLDEEIQLADGRATKSLKFLRQRFQKC